MEKLKVCNCNGQYMPTADIHILGEGSTEEEQCIATLSFRHKEAAKLICACVNACIGINKDNPLAVAEGLKDLIMACENLMASLENWEVGRESTERDIRLCFNLAKPALSNVRGE